MKLCFLSVEGGRFEAPESSRALAGLLAERHEVTLICLPGEPGWEEPPPAPAGVREIRAEAGPTVADLGVASEEHRRSAVALEAIATAYGVDGPDYVEAPGRGSAALVPLLARRGRHRSLLGTRIGIRLVGNTEVEALSEGTFGLPGTLRRCDLEREQLRLADAIVWPGAAVPEIYRRLGAVAPHARIGVPLAETDPPPAPGDGPLRILFAGGLRRAAGAIDLAEACLRLGRDEWELTMAGADSETAGFGGSVREAIEEMFAGDPRLRFTGRLEAAELREELSRHDLVAMPSLVPAWPREALEAMAAGLPLLVQPVEGLAEMVDPGRTGWVAAGLGAPSLRAAIEALLAEPGQVREIRAGAAPSQLAARLAGPEAIVAAYDALLGDGQARSRPASAPANAEEAPLVTGIVPYHRASRYVAEAVESLLGQTHTRMDVLVVNDGSFEPEDEILLELADRPGVTLVTSLNRGEATARNVAATLARGDYLVMLDADNALEPEFVSRALEVFAAEPALAYVSCWLRFVGPDGELLSGPTGFAAMGNAVVSDDVENWDGDTLAMLPRRLFTELGASYEPAGVAHPDWEFYRSLRERSLYGTVIQEFLARYRVVPDSLLRTYSEGMNARGWEEAIERRMLRQRLRGVTR